MRGRKKFELPIREPVSSRNTILRVRLRDAMRCFTKWYVLIKNARLLNCEKTLLGCQVLKWQAQSPTKIQITKEKSKKANHQPWSSSIETFSNNLLSRKCDVMACNPCLSLWYGPKTGTIAGTVCVAIPSVFLAQQSWRNFLVLSTFTWVYGNFKWNLWKAVCLDWIDIWPRKGIE